MKSIILLITFIIAPLANLNTEDHKYYVSVTEVNYVKAEESLQITTQIFIDDFEKLLKERYDEHLTLLPDSNVEEIDGYISRYLAGKLKIKVDEKDVNFKYIGKEYKDDIAYCYLEVEKVKEINSLEITNRALFDVFEEQQNIVRLKLLGKNKSFLLVPDNDKCMLNFN